MENAVLELVQRAGSQVALAEQLGVTQQAISKWIRRGYVPVRRVLECEAQYGVPRAKLLDPRLRDLVDDSVLA